MNKKEIFQLIELELSRRKKAEIDLNSRKEKIQNLIQQHCNITPKGNLSRESWQDFCFKHLFNRECHTNIPFSTYLNTLMPELGYPLGFAHTKLRVYKGLEWKTE